MFIASSWIQFGGNEAFSPQKLTVARGPKGRLGGICTLTDLCLGLGPIGTLEQPLLLPLLHLFHLCNVLLLQVCAAKGTVTPPLFL